MADGGVLLPRLAPGNHVVLADDLGNRGLVVPKPLRRTKLLLANEWCPRARLMATP